MSDAERLLERLGLLLAELDQAASAANLLDDPEIDRQLGIAREAIINAGGWATARKREEQALR